MRAYVCARVQVLRILKVTESVGVHPYAAVSLMREMAGPGYTNGHTTVLCADRLATFVTRYVRGRIVAHVDYIAHDDDFYVFENGCSVFVHGVHGDIVLDAKHDALLRRLLASPTASNHGRDLHHIEEFQKAFEGVLPLRISYLVMSCLIEMTRSSETGFLNLMNKSPVRIGMKCAEVRTVYPMEIRLASMKMKTAAVRRLTAEAARLATALDEEEELDVIEEEAIESEIDSADVVHALPRLEGTPVHTRRWTVSVTPAKFIESLHSITSAGSDDSDDTRSMRRVHSLAEREHDLYHHQATARKKLLADFELTSRQQLAEVRSIPLHNPPAADTFEPLDDCDAIVEPRLVRFDDNSPQVIVRSPESAPGSAVASGVPVEEFSLHASTPAANRGEQNMELVTPGAYLEHPTLEVATRSLCESMQAVVMEPYLEEACGSAPPDDSFTAEGSFLMSPHLTFAQKRERMHNEARAAYEASPESKVTVHELKARFEGKYQDSMKMIGTRFIEYGATPTPEERQMFETILYSDLRAREAAATPAKPASFGMRAARAATPAKALASRFTPGRQPFTNKTKI
jgi:hypothetical protein